MKNQWQEIAEKLVAEHITISNDGKYVDVRIASHFFAIALEEAYEKGKKSKEAIKEEKLNRMCKLFNEMMPERLHIGRDE